MHDHGRSRLRRRTAGLTMVRTWTRWSVGAGVALSAVLSAGLAYVLPGHAANTPATRHSATTSSRPAPAPSATGHRHVHHHHKRHRLTPPAGTPRPAPPQTQAPQPPTQQPAQPPATSGGS